MLVYFVFLVRLSPEMTVLGMGIFLGLQADGWNKGRKERVQEHIFLERLLVDTERSIELQNSDIEFMNGFIDGHKVVYKHYKRK